MINEGQKEENLKNEDSEPLHHAAAEGKFEEVKSLLAAGADPNKRNRSGQPPLHLAGNAAVAELLVQAGADVNLLNTVGRTPLYRAAMDLGYHRDPEWSGAIKAEFLLKHGAAPDLRDVRKGDTALMIALARGNTAVARILIEHGADITLRTKTKQTLLHICHDPSLLEDLIYRGLDVNAEDEDGNSPLHLCSSVRSARVLLSKGAFIEATNNGGATSLHLCQRLDVVDFLIKQGGDFLARDYDGDQPIHLTRNIEKIDLLLKMGVSVETRDNLGFTPLHLCQDVEVAKFLLCRGASINCMTPTRVTPLHIAALQGLPDMVSFLLKHGARADIADCNGRTPIMLALLRHNTDHDPKNPMLALLPEIISLLQTAASQARPSSPIAWYQKKTATVIKMESGSRKKSISE